MSGPPAKRENLTLSYWNPNWDEWEDTRTVEDAEFDVLARAWAVERGWVEPKACGECDGAGWLGSMMGGGSPKSCPSCGGTGRERLIAVGGIDVEALRKALENFYPLGIPSIPSWPNVEQEGYESWLVELGVAVLAALEGETE